MKLYLLRHAEAVAISEDIKRPLSTTGCKEIRLITHFLISNHVNVADIWHSGILRAAQTAELLGESLQPRPKLSMMQGLLPDDSVEPIAAYCNHLESETLIVAHLPFIANLASSLLFNNGQGSAVDFQTATLLCLERIARQQWCISWLVSPNIIAPLINEPY